MLDQKSKIGTDQTRSVRDSSFGRSLSNVRVPRSSHRMQCVKFNVRFYLQAYKRTTQLVNVILLRLRAVSRAAPSRFMMIEACFAVPSH